jgi:hypothetical protein
VQHSVTRGAACRWLADGPRALYHLDVISHRSLFSQASFDKFFIPRGATRIAVQILKELSPLSATDSGNDVLREERGISLLPWFFLFLNSRPSSLCLTGSFSCFPFYGYMYNVSTMAEESRIAAGSRYRLSSRDGFELVVVKPRLYSTKTQMSTTSHAQHCSRRLMINLSECQTEASRRRWYRMIYLLTRSWRLTIWMMLARSSSFDKTPASGDNPRFLIHCVRRFEQGIRLNKSKVALIISVPWRGVKMNPELAAERKSRYDRTPRKEEKQEPKVKI